MGPGERAPGPEPGGPVRLPGAPHLGWWPVPPCPRTAPPERSGGGPRGPDQHRNPLGIVGSQAKPGFFLGTSPRNRKEITTLRVIPTVRESFKPAGIQQANFDALPNYWDAPIHNIRKRTERTRNCDTCHEDRKGFLTMETLLKDSSRVNLELIKKPKPIPVSQ